MTAITHPFLEDLDPKHVKAIEQVSKTMEFSEAHRLIQQGKAYDHIFLIHQGMVAIRYHAPGRGPRTIDTAGPGDYVGWSWLTASTRAQHEAIVVEPVVATAIQASALRELCNSDHELGFHVLSRMVHLLEHRLQGMRLLLLDVYGNSN